MSERLEPQLYPCAVLGCGRIAETVYTAMADGELAGWALSTGDEIRFCREHASALYRDRDPLWGG